MNPVPHDALFAWMIPYYAMVAMTNVGALMGNKDAAWQAIRAKIEEHTDKTHTALLDRMFQMEKTHDAVDGLARLWAPLAR